MKRQRIEFTLKGIDKTMTAVILLLLFYGSVMVFSASAPYAESTYGDSLYYVKRQIFWAAIGLTGMFASAALPPEIHRKYTSVIGFSIAAVLLVIVLFTGGAIKRWINIGFFSIQPSELMKPMLILMMAKYMEYAQNYIKRNGIYKSGGLLGRIADKRSFMRASMYGVFIPTLIIVIFSGGAMLRWFVGAAAVLCSAVFAVLFGTDYASERIDIWLHPENFSVTDETWQITQGLIAVGSGGIFGRGLGNGLQKHLYVSAPHNDFIFSIVCEELGLIGAAAVIGLFFMFVRRALQLAMRCETLFMSLVAVGIAGHVGLQAFLNIAVVTATIPNTGVTLPFFSYGGSALVVLLCESGILLSVTKNKTKSERERQV